MAENKKRLLTGLQPSGTLHIGNYFGTIKPFIEAYEHAESFLMVANYHALTTLHNSEQLHKNTVDIVIDYVASGVDPKKAIIFKQSDISEHTELAWIFECIVTVPYLMQAHSYKDKVAKGLEANAGLFNYPMLMAADILLYDIDMVPVGKDQKQHIEYTREVAAKFNNAYGQTFKEPNELTYTNVGTVPGTDGQKMSKSYGNTIPLFGSLDEISKAVMSIVTDSEGGRPEHVYAIHKLYKSEDKLTDLYAKNEGNYKALKEALIEDIDRHVAPMREKQEELAKDPSVAINILEEGAEKAKEIASKKMENVRKKIGVTL